MSQAGSALAWQRWLEQRYARADLVIDAWWEGYWSTGPGSEHLAASRADIEAGRVQTFESGEAFLAFLDHQHDWTYAGSAFQKPAETFPDAQCDFSGFIEKCATCGEIRQIPV